MTDHPIAPPPYYHGTRANLAVGDQLQPGWMTNFGTGKPAGWIYFAATLEAAIWGAELAQGAARERIYLVEPSGAVENDPNVTDKRFPGNPTKSYRTRGSLRVVGEVTEWSSHPPEQLQAMKDFVARMTAEGVEAEDD
ncbi:NAD(+)--rifampin ADP-ribosyltransferase [Sphingomonas antarctica]|uniref:NAD(+)--rifampin ADP-ribosyltransferase n=1 Tax=Sphingomonas antarctica TaxID=2040274 RepID=UPI0039E9F6C9